MKHSLERIKRDADGAIGNLSPEQRAGDEVIVDATIENIGYRVHYQKFRKDTGGYVWQLTDYYALA